MRWYLAISLLLFGLVLGRFAIGHPNTASCDVYVTVGKGNEGEDGPVGGASVVLTAPDGGTQTKKTDFEGTTKFTVEKTGRYLLKVDADGFDTYDGRVIVDGKDPQVYHLAVLVPAKSVDGKARIKVKAVDADSGFAIEGAQVETTAAHLANTDRMETDGSGEAMVRLPFANADRYSSFKVTVSAPGYVKQIQEVKLDSREGSVKNLEFSLRRDVGTRIILITTREEGTRAPVMSAQVTIDGGGKSIQSLSTNGDGAVTFRVTENVPYKVTIRTSLYEEVTDTIDLAADKTTPSILRTYDLEKKASAREIRRALYVFVKAKDEKGVIRPLAGARVDGPGLHSPVTDAAGRMVFLHKTPPGELIKVTAESDLYEPESGEVLVKDKGVMVDLRQFGRDSLSMGDYEAARKQGVTGFDTITITLKVSKYKLVQDVNGEIEAPEEATPGDEVAYSTNLTLKEGPADSITVEEVIQVLDSANRIVARAGSIRALEVGEVSTKSFAFTPSKAGTYRIKVVVKFESHELYKGEKAIRVAEDRRKPTISGDVVPKKGRVKLDEMVSVGVNVLYESGPTDPMRFSETVELFDPKGEVVQNNLGARNLKIGVYSERNFNITCQAPGDYRLKSTIRDDAGNVLWTGEGRFTVEKAGTAVMEKGTGYFRLKSKKVGKGSDSTDGQYGSGNSTTTESSFSYTYEGKAPYDSHAKFSVQWSVPPTIIKPNDSFELTVSGSGSVTGKDRGYVGIGAGWDVSGTASIASKEPMFVGLDSNGKEHPSGSAKWKIIVGAGGPFKLWSYAGGAPGISSDAHTPCIFEYEWVEGAKPPTDSNGKPTMTVGGERNVPAKPNAYRSSSVSLGSIGSVSLELTLGKDFSGSGKSADGRVIISMGGGFTERTGQLSGSGTVSRSGTRYTITVKAQKSGSEITGTIEMKSGKGTVKHPFRLKKG